MTVSGTVTGGNGGTHGIGPNGNGGDGPGGDGIIGQNLNVTVSGSGSVIGGLAGDGTTRQRHHLQRRHDSLEIQSGYTITGNVVGTGGDTFKLGGSTDGSFAVTALRGPIHRLQRFRKNRHQHMDADRYQRHRDPWAVNAGTLSVTGTMANSTMTVNNSGTLGGTGTVGGTTINNGGTLAPGTTGSPTGTLTVGGNLTFNASSNYNVTVSPATASQTTVTGTASLTGGTVNATFQSGSYVTKTYTILTSAGLGGTTFAGLTTTGLPGGFQAKLDYTPTGATTDVDLDLTAALLGGSGGGGLNGNQQNVANTINNYFNNGGTLSPSFVTLFGLTGTQLSNALSQLTGESTGGIVLASNTFTNSFLSLILNPFAGAQFGSGGAAIGYARAPSVSREQAAAYAAVTPKDLRPDTFDRRWSVWAQGYGGYNRTDGNTTTGSTDTTVLTYGVTTGFDYHVNPDLLVGFALAGGATNWGLAQGLGGGRSDVFQQPYTPPNSAPPIWPAPCPTLGTTSPPTAR